jgi:FkbM family methyltransferase
MFKKLYKLQMLNYTPDIIFDIGAHKGEWTRDSLCVYPSSKYYLYEPTEYDELKKYKSFSNINIFNVLLYEKDEKVQWYENKSTGDSIFKEISKHYKDINPYMREAITLNTHIINNNINYNNKKILLKLDTQGAEISILKGISDNMLQYVDFIIMEMPFFGQYNNNVPNFLEHIQYMDSIGFIPFEICEEHIVGKYTMQIDMLFINKNNKLNEDVQKQLVK